MNKLKTHECLESSFNVAVDYPFKAVYKVWGSSFQETQMKEHDTLWMEMCNVTLWNEQPWTWIQFSFCSEKRCIS